VYIHVPKIQLCGSFICIGEEYIIDLSATLRIVKIDGKGHDFCVAFYLNSSTNEAILFESELSRDIFFERVKLYISYINLKG